MRIIRLDDTLGHLVPPGRLRPSHIRDGLVEAMSQRRFTAGLGVPAVPTRFVVTMNPADRAWLPPTTEDHMERALRAHAEAAGFLLLGDIEVRFATDPAAAQGRPSFWAGFAEKDLPVLAGADAALEVFARR